MTMRDLLVRGMVAGLIASVLAFGFASLIGEPPIEAAIALEGAAGEAHTHDTTPAAAAPVEAEPEVVTRGVQRTIGLATGIAMLGTAFGGVFAIAFAFIAGRVGAFSARATALAIALTAWGVIYLVPYLKYPPNPPAVGDGETIQYRTAMYLVMLAISVFAALAALALGRRMAAQSGAWNASLVAGGLFLTVVTVGYLLLPVINEVPETFPADLLWSFRIASLGTQLVLWIAIGLVFGALTERALRGNSRPVLTRAGAR